MATQLQREIGNLKKSILTLSALVEDNLRRALDRRGDGATRRSPPTAIERDFPIDLMEVDVEEDCLKALALYQPVAGDLRFIVTTIKINTTLERVGDLAVNIAERAGLLAAMDQPVVAFDMAGMAAKAQRMVVERPRCPRGVRRRRARAVLLADDEVDDLDRELTATLERRRPGAPRVARRRDLAAADLALHRARGRPRHKHRRRRDLYGRGRDPRHSVKRAVAEAMGYNAAAAPPPAQD